jgi:hypothetical protein
MFKFLMSALIIWIIGCKSNPVNPNIISIDTNSVKIGVEILTGKVIKQIKGVKGYTYFNTVCHIHRDGFWNADTAFIKEYDTVINFDTLSDIKFVTVKKGSTLILNNTTYNMVSQIEINYEIDKFDSLWFVKLDPTSAFSYYDTSYSMSKILNVTKDSKDTILYHSEHGQMFIQHYANYTSQPIDTVF